MSTPPGAGPEAVAPIRGRALVLGDHVNADLLHPPAFFSLDAAQVRAGFLAGLGGQREDGTEDARWIIVAGRNFGCGSSRETTIQALRHGGVVAVVAPSFGRIFQRSAAALGLRCFASDGPLSSVAAGDALVVDPSRPSLSVESRGVVIALAEPDPFLAAVCVAGGLLEWLGHRGS